LQAKEVACAPIYELGEVFGDPLVQSLGMLKTFLDPWGKVQKTVGSGVDFSDTPAVAPTRAPLLGEHNREVLAEFGLSRVEISRLEKSGVVGAPDPRIAQLAGERSAPSRGRSDRQPIILKGKA